MRLTGALQVLQVLHTFYSRYYYRETARQVQRGAVDLAAPWCYLEHLRRGGKLVAGRDYMFEPPSMFEGFVRRLEARVIKEHQRCGGCGAYGDYAACGNCLSTFYCSEPCYHGAWEEGHQAECAALRQATFGTAVYAVPAQGRELALLQSSRRYSGLWSAARERMEEMEAEVRELEEEQEKDSEVGLKLQQELKKAVEQVKKLKKTKAGLTSGLARIKVRERKEEVKVKGEGVQTMVGLGKEDVVVRMVAVEVKEVKELQVFRGQELKVTAGREGKGRSYGAPLYLRLPSPQQCGAATALATSTMLQRGRQVMELLQLVASGGKEVSPAEAAANLKVLLVELTKRHAGLVEELLRERPQLLKSVMTLSAESGSRMMTEAQVSWSLMRNFATMLEKELGVRVFGSERQIRRLQAAATTAVSREKLYSSNLLLYKTGKSEFPTLCGSSKVKSLPEFLAGLVQQVGLGGGGV